MKIVHSVGDMETKSDLLKSKTTLSLQACGILSSVPQANSYFNAREFLDPVQIIKIIDNCVADYSNPW